MNNMNGTLDMQKRMLLMTVIILVIFISYEFLVLKPQKDLRLEKEKIELTKKNSINSKNSMSIVEDKNSAPIVENIKEDDIKRLPSNNLLSKNNIISTIKTKNNIITIDRLGRILQVQLLGKQYIDDKNRQINLFDTSKLRPLEIRFSNKNINNEAFTINVIASSSNIDARKSVQKLILTQKLSKTTLKKILTIYPNGNYNIEVVTNPRKNFFITTGFRPDVLADMYAEHGVIMKLSDGSTNIISDEDLDKTTTFNKIDFISAFDRYYATVLYNFDKSFKLSLMPDKDENPQVFIHSNGNIKLGGYIGPKYFDILNNIDPKLTDVIEYGFFTFLAKPMFIFLKFLYDYVGNWGWTIVLLTLIIKLLLYPLSYKGMVSMQKLKDLTPKIKAIQEKHKDDKQKASIAMMDLYKKHGANPMGGCLPILLQIPIFFAIYRVLLNSIELKGASWILWIEDLALMDPYYILPILMGATMYLQQKITPNTMQDEMQKKIFQLLPVIFTFFFLWFPAGLTLYWFVNNVFTVGQQYYINRLFDKRREEKISLQK